ARHRSARSFMISLTELGSRRFSSCASSSIWRTLPDLLRYCSSVTPAAHKSPKNVKNSTRLEKQLTSPTAYSAGNPISDRISQSAQVSRSRVNRYCLFCLEANRSKSGAGAFGIAVDCNSELQAAVLLKLVVPTVAGSQPLSIGPQAGGLGEVVIT